MSSKAEFPLFFKIATPILVSGIIGLFVGIIEWHIFIAILIALYGLLCAANGMEAGRQR